MNLWKAHHKEVKQVSVLSFSIQDQKDFLLPVNHLAERFSKILLGRMKDNNLLFCIDRLKSRARFIVCHRYVCAAPHMGHSHSPWLRGPSTPRRPTGTLWRESEAYPSPQGGGGVGSLPISLNAKKLTRVQATANVHIPLAAEIVPLAGRCVALLP